MGSNLSLEDIKKIAIGGIDNLSKTLRELHLTELAKEIENETKIVRGD